YRPQEPSETVGAAAIRRPSDEEAPDIIMQHLRSPRRFAAPRSWRHRISPLVWQLFSCSGQGWYILNVNRMFVIPYTVRQDSRRASGEMSRGIKHIQARRPNQW